MTTTIDPYKMKEELVVFLRNQDIFTITQRGVATTTEEFNGNTILVDFTVSNSNMKNVRSVTVGGVAQTLGTDYTVDYSSYTITFTTAPGSGTNNVDIQYDYGTDKIFGDLPKNTLKISNFPRIGVDLIGMDTAELGIGGSSNVTNVTFSIYVYEAKTEDLDNYMKDIRTAIIANKKSFYYSPFTTPITLGPLLNFIDGNNKIYQRNVDVISLLNVEEA